MKENKDLEKQCYSLPKKKEDKHCYYSHTNLWTNPSNYM